MSLRAEHRPRFTLVFHGIGTPPATVDPVEDWYWCDEGAFATILDALAIARTAGDLDVRLTFDDGNMADIETTAPALAARGLHGTFFVCSGRLKSPDRYLGPSDLRALRAMGMGIGSHGKDHVRLRDTSQRGLRMEAVGSKAVIEYELGEEITEFALPYGNYDGRVIEALGHYLKIHTTDARAGRTKDRMVHRFCYTRGWDDAALSRIVDQHPGRLQSARTWAKVMAKRSRRPFLIEK